MKKIIVISSFTKSLINFRYDLLKFLVENQFDVYALGPDDDKDSIKQLEKIGVTFKKYYLKRNGFNPLEDIKSIKNLRNIFKEIEPNYILPYTIKPVIYSNIARKGLNIKSLSWITGVGFYGNESKSLKDSMIKAIITKQYQVGINSKDVFIFQNNDDLELFQKRNILKKNTRTIITPGSGVNLDMFISTPPPINPITFVFVGRLLKEKGIDLFIEAAKEISLKYTNAKFLVIGGLSDTSPNCILKPNEVKDLEDSGIIKFTGKVPNVLEYITNSSVFVLPSIYREGIPRSILEALSVGRAVITTNNVGCKETVIKDYNGILIEKNSKEQLINAMELFCINPNLIIEYGKNSRIFAEQKFDVKIVNKLIFDAIQHD